MSYSKKDFTTPQDALMHYGRKGMRWGVVNEDDTTGGSSNVSEKSKAAQKVIDRETKAKKRDASAKKYQTQINEIKAKPSTYKFVQNQRDKKIAVLANERDKQKIDATRIREGKLTVGERNLAIGGSIAAGLLLAYGAYKLGDGGEFNRALLKGQAFISKTPHSWKKNDALSKIMDENGIMHDVVSKINPDYGKFGTKNNCRRCTFAYEMRRRGYDVRATLTDGGVGQTNIGLFNATDPNSHLPTTGLGLYKSLIKESIDNPDVGGPVTKALTNNPWGKNMIDFTDSKINGLSGSKPSGVDILDRVSSGELKSNSIFNSLQSHPTGARGELGMGWEMGGGHSMAWEIVKGKPVIFDTQSGKKYASASEFTAMAKNMSSAGFTRLDNIQLNDDFLMRWLKDA